MTGAAICLAVSAAIVFGLAAVTQHRAVRTTVQSRRGQLSLHQVRGLLTDSRWRRGFALMLLGTGLHVAALSMAPISLTQPINVLAVPTTIIATAVLARQRPYRSVVLAAIAVVAGVAGVVTALSGGAAGTLPDPALLGGVGATVVTVTVLLHGAARQLLARPTTARSWAAPVLLAVAGAVNFGTASSTFRLLAQDLSGAQPLPVWTALALVGSVSVALTAGSWSIHQAYAAGAAPAVTAASALADPMVAIVLGLAVLGESHHLAAGRWALLLLAAGLAACGVVHLARRDDTTPDRSSLSHRQRAPSPLATHP